MPKGENFDPQHHSNIMAGPMAGHPELQALKHVCRIAGASQPMGKSVRNSARWYDAEPCGKSRQHRESARATATSPRRQRFHTGDDLDDLARDRRLTLAVVAERKFLNELTGIARRTVGCRNARAFL